VLIKIDTWQLEGNTDRMPTTEEMKDFLTTQALRRVFMHPKIYHEIKEDLDNSDIVKVTIDNPRMDDKEFYVTAHGAIFTMEGKYTGYDDGSPAFQEIWEQALLKFNDESLSENTDDAAISDHLHTAISTGIWDEAAENEFDNITNQIENGKILFERFPQKMDRTVLGILAQAEAVVTGADAKTDGEDSWRGSEVTPEKKVSFSLQEAAIESWAKKEALWFNEYSDKRARPYPSLEAMLSSEYVEDVGGSESLVYLDEKHNEVIKTISLSHYNGDVQMGLDRIAMHNALFPDTALTVIGFGRDSSGNFRIIAKQPFVQGESASVEEIEQFAKDLGLTKGKGWWYDNNKHNKFRIADLNPANVLKDSDGHLHVIDCDIELKNKSSEIIPQGQT